MRGTHNRAGQLFRMAAFGLHHELSPMGDHLRRMKSKIGPAAAQTATAHKIAIIFYTMVKNQVEYDASIWAERDAEREKRFEANSKDRLTPVDISLSKSRKPSPRKRLIPGDWGVSSSKVGRVLVPVVRTHPGAFF